MTEKLLVVTGGARGIGASIAELSAKAGYEVSIWDTDLSSAIETAERLGEGCHALQVDVSDAGSVNAAFDQLSRVPYGVVNNAGIVRFGPLLNLTVQDWNLALGVNLTGTFLVSREFARRSDPAEPGCVVNIASINGVSAAPNAGAYSASKAGVVMLTQQMALEWAPKGMRVNCVAPGLIDAGMSEPIYEDDEIRAYRQEKVPLNRLGSAEEVASAVLFLLDESASYVTGQTIVVDGGISISALGKLARPASVDSVGH